MQFSVFYTMIPGDGLKDLMKWKSEHDLLPHIDVFLAKTGLEVEKANRAEFALSPPSAHNTAVCEYTEQYSQSTTGLYTA